VRPLMAPLPRQPGRGVHRCIQALVTTAGNGLTLRCARHDSNVRHTDSKLAAAVSVECALSTRFGSVTRIPVDPAERRFASVPWVAIPPDSHRRAVISVPVMRDSLVDFFASSRGFVVSAFVFGGITLALAWPAQCRRLVGGDWIPCPVPCTSEPAAEVSCANMFGGPCVDERTAAGLLAMAVGFLLGAVAHALGEYGRSKRG